MRALATLPGGHQTSSAGRAGAATYVKRLWKGHLRRSQLPDTLTDEVGAIAKPANW